ncbi:hypothetical protein ES288_D04G212400v1 [Gossypium darwinii]|uniref:Uncharacterized protein n=1 Tax=Gossypium darwinii TaxID=34276 RepID=A0A5D2CYS5_GOSDA|nr:hypothetical protein ES288_D04G212400v1 [Gossypium darwinii]
MGCPAVAPAYEIISSLCLASFWRSSILFMSSMFLARSVWSCFSKRCCCSLCFII